MTQNEEAITVLLDDTKIKVNKLGGVCVVFVNHHLK